MLFQDEKASADSRTYSLTTSEEEGLKRDETDPPPLGARDDFGSGEIEFAPQETQAILRVIDRLNCGATVSSAPAAGGRGGGINSLILSY